MHLFDFPEEVLILIISYLSLRDRKNLSLVNKYFYELTHHKSVMKDDVLVVETTSELKLLEIRKKAYSLRIKRTNNEVSTQFWTECGDIVKCLELYLVDLTQPVILKILEAVPNLEYLVISSYDEHDRTKVPPQVTPTAPLSFKHLAFPALLSMDFWHIVTSLEGRNLHEIVEKSPKLKRLSFEWMVNTWDDVSFVKKCLETHENDLKELDVSYSQLTDPMLDSILRDVGSQLTGFYLRKCNGLTRGSLALIAKKFPQLKEIDIAMTDFPHEDIYEFLVNSTNLTHVSLRQTNFQKIGQCLDNAQKLKALELSNCKRWIVTDPFITTPFPNLVDLRIDYLRIKDEVLKSIVPLIPNIKQLVLNGNRQITDQSLSILSEKCTKLRSLSLQDTKVSDIRWANRLKGLIHLDLYGCRKVTKDSLLKLNLLELQTLDLSMTQADCDSLDTIIRNCPSLLHIYLDSELQLDAPSCPHTQFHYGMSRFAPESIFDS